MKPKFDRILSQLDNEVYKFRHFSDQLFSTNFHFHKEIQINYIQEGSGQRVIGDNISNFEKDELTLLGSNLPHVWYSNQPSQPDEKQAMSITLFIDVEKCLQILAQLQETHNIRSFFNQMERGVIFTGKSKAQLTKLLFAINEAENLERTIYFLQLLNQLTKTEDFQYISSTSYRNRYSSQEFKGNQIDHIIRFVLENYNKDIKLDEAAEMANMTKQAFCRFFKARTQKSFIQFVNETRISIACQEIMKNDNLISNVAYDCGFSSLSNFNKIFKSIKGITPRQFKERLIGKNEA
ncbi:AraC family transcriptional regulator [Sphingobacterium cellulitidis]|uniref:AraC family transcriptional regulator n=1 Tax=Sphingobacterium cellulitidis TaxID=1768011 RepID=A0A8H9G1Q0_9SPHI|nr:AraC family transcriptional regulator [Sphingobacterium soli]MBA8988557.1 AraC-like DNA-binding protein [Sphingobacterium soli]GGE33762.1 AraC family transcriptional regulator [Sphingobacterium soli]